MAFKYQKVKKTNNIFKDRWKPNPDLERSVYSDIPITKEGEYALESFAIVVTKEMCSECILLINSIRQYHDQPIYILVDEESKYILESCGVPNIHLSYGLSESGFTEAAAAVAEIKKHNTFHKPDIIFKKMEIMDLAMKYHNSTLFLDADIIILKPLPECYDTEIVLSPHYHPNIIKDKHFGAFNAGYVFCANPKFPNYWRGLYLNRSTFYEQQGMDYIPENFNTAIFPKSHNVGIWRELKLSGLEEISPVSIHCHTEIKVFDNNEVAMLLSVQKLLGYLIHYLNKFKYDNILQFLDIDRINDVIKFKKFAFIHYGKSAGTYIVKYMQRHCLKGYVNYNSWNYGWNRDFTEDELFQIAEEAGDYSFVHNHHISWSRESILKFKEEGWLLFTFIRDPRELLCSLYFWAKDNCKILSSDPLPETLNEFIIEALQNKEYLHLWALPYYDIQLHVIEEFTDRSFNDFLSLYFDGVHVSEDHINTSSNKGFKYYLSTGEFSNENYELLKKHKEYKRYKKYMELDDV